MNKKAREWVDYLKTNPPKYKGGLISEDDFCKRCCLGHALDFGDTEDISKDYLLFTNVISCEDAKVLGINSNSGYAWDKNKNEVPLKFRGEIIKNFNKGNVKSLVALNDLTDFDHAQIAEIIEENQDVLFVE